MEARKKGIPYSRSGPSLFLHDINALFDTPEDIFEQLNREGIEQVDFIFFTH
jgi:phosphoribosyl 1,2-cyclic phosphate phosphodiesterase